MILAIFPLLGIRASANLANVAPGSGLVKMSDTFIPVSMCCTSTIPAATASRQRWEAIARCFFFNGYCTCTHTLFITPRLSPCNAVGPFTGIPMDRSKNLEAFISSMAIFNAMYSASNVLPATVACLLYLNFTGVLP